MGIALSLILIAGGAVLDWAVDVQTTGVSWPTVGAILMAVGAVGLVVSLAVLVPRVWRNDRGFDAGYDEGYAAAGRGRYDEGYADGVRSARRQGDYGQSTYGPGDLRQPEYRER